MQKKTCALAGLAAVAAASGVLVSSSPASAQSTLVQHHRHWRHHSVNHNVNWNRNRNHNRVVVRVNVHNSNRNVAFAGNERRRGFDDDFGFFRHRRCHLGCGGGFDNDDFGRGRDDDDDRGDNIIVGNDFRSLGDRG